MTPAEHPIDPAVLGEYQPRNQHETTAAVRAVHDQRHALDALEAVAALSPFERELIHLAFAAGQRTVGDAIDEAVGPAAHTVDRATLIGFVKSKGMGKRLQLGIPGWTRDDGSTVWGHAPEPLAADIVSSARRNAALVLDRDPEDAHFARVTP